MKGLCVCGAAPGLVEVRARFDVIGVDPSSRTMLRRQRPVRQRLRCIMMPDPIIRCVDIVNAVLGPGTRPSGRIRAPEKTVLEEEWKGEGNEERARTCGTDNRWRGEFFVLVSETSHVVYSLRPQRRLPLQLCKLNRSMVAHSTQLQISVHRTDIFMVRCCVRFPYQNGCTGIGLQKSVEHDAWEEAFSFAMWHDAEFISHVMSCGPPQKSSACTLCFVLGEVADPPAVRTCLVPRKTRALDFHLGLDSLVPAPDVSRPPPNFAFICTCTYNIRRSRWRSASTYFYPRTLLASVGPRTGDSRGSPQKPVLQKACGPTHAHKPYRVKGDEDTYLYVIDTHALGLSAPFFALASETDRTQSDPGAGTAC
ncbi:hypothetical protein BKA93DRAFT_97559 [Sparassis latifolia]